eukprot:CAMPEP_0197528810 /NCGR_PEP_ID=MMETSP1318-20131121/26387_1 /TAXON_ID=552666 /ORGANISM="Partenskyella glossopodia, Strain RCC365" /LENGTH=655 /DNA_ID=CAMNT_0043084049 /DNA_START=55 /DNA_END=2022 /DNA_ORIENTATION=-
MVGGILRRAFRSLQNPVFARNAGKLAGIVALGGGACWFQTYVAEACGIVGYVGKENAVEYLLEGIHILQNRGYDSAGVATIDENGVIQVTKYASLGTTSDCVEKLQDEAPSRHKGHNIGIGHTRWATHGGKTDENAHPHTDHKNRVAVIHNGTIENSEEIKDRLLAAGIPFKSQTDTEVIAQLIGTMLDEGLEIIPAVHKALSQLEGTWGLCILCKSEPGKIVVCRNGSPLLLGMGKNRTFIASEVSGFSRHVNEYIALKDGEIAVVRADGVSLDLSRLEKAEKQVIELDPAPYPHWTLKEIYEQPQAIARAIAYGARLSVNGEVILGGFAQNADDILAVDNLIITGCGTSLNAGIYGSILMRSLKAFNTVQCIDAAEMTADHAPAVGGGLLALSQSGETKDVMRALETSKNAGIPVFSVVNVVGSLIARTTGLGVYVHAGRENAVASTKAFTGSVTCLALIASWFAQNRQGLTNQQKRKELVDCLHRLPTYMGMCLPLRDQCRDLAQKLIDKDHMFILGKGLGEPIAQEGALKIKEVSYIHAEGYGGGSLKHGPFALLDEGVPVIFLILDGPNAQHMRIAAQEVKARGAFNICITDNPHLCKGIADEVIAIPNNGPLTALLAVIPLQLLAYELSVARGINPDKPRHLAKAVTVD